MRYGIIALTGAAAVALAACSSSSTPAPTTTATATAKASPSSPTTTAKPNKPGDRVAGLIASVSGNTIQVAEKSSTATIAFTNETTVAEMYPAQLSDVTAGSCVSIRPTRDSQPSGPVTAHAVVVSPVGNGQCPQAQHGRGVRGAVASVTGNTIAVTTQGNPNPTTVEINGDTRYAKRVGANSQAITAGKCIAGRGTEDSSGALQATSITVRQAGNRPCPSPRR
ncbi:MAG: 27 kDa lipoprotein antigen [Mycobacterium sp.]|nr:27 kDa lipoprotein antigen [Mycobacterium sp.]